MEVWGADIGNAYLEATKEKLYIVSGPEFEELQGHSHRESMASCYNSDSNHSKQIHVYG